MQGNAGGQVTFVFMAICLIAIPIVAWIIEKAPATNRRPKKNYQGYYTK